MFTISFFVPGKPQGKGRHRTRVISPRSGGKPFATQYADKGTVMAENYVKECFTAVVGERLQKPHDGPVSMSIHAGFPFLKSWSKKKTQEALDTMVPHVGKPDADNIEKCIADALNQIAYKDDSQIFRMTVTKSYRENPGVIVTIRFYPDGKLFKWPEEPVVVNGGSDATQT